MSERSIRGKVTRFFFLLLVVSMSLIGCGEGETSDPTGIEEDGYFRTFVWFATDRQIISSADRVRVGRDRGTGELSYGKVEVSIPDSHEIGEIESPAWYQFFNRDDPSEFVLVLSLDVYEGQPVFSSEIQNQLVQGASDEALIFIHGFNVSFEDAAKRTAQLAYDLRFPGIPILYSWPSQGSFSKYPADEERVKWTKDHLEEFLNFVVTDLGLSRVNIVAHSMGNRALLNALANFEPPSVAEGAAMMNQIVLAAPDIDVGVFRQLAEDFRDKAERYTLYTSPNDKAIELSRRFHDSPRAGGSVVLVDGIDTIDASAVETSFLAHSYFGDSILLDIFSLVRNGLPPELRFGLREENSEAGKYWVFEPGAF